MYYMWWNNLCDGDTDEKESIQLILEITGCARVEHWNHFRLMSMCRFVFKLKLVTQNGVKSGCKHHSRQSVWYKPGHGNLFVLALASCRMVSVAPIYFCCGPQFCMGLHHQCHVIYTCYCDLFALAFMYGVAAASATHTFLAWSQFQLQIPFWTWKICSALYHWATPKWAVS